MPHICVSESGQHWFREWLVAYSAPSHYLNQCWVIVNWTLRNTLLWNFYQDAGKTRTTRTPAFWDTLRRLVIISVLDKMCKYEMDPSRTVGATERTRAAGRTDGVKPKCTIISLIKFKIWPRTSFNIDIIFLRSPRLLVPGKMAHIWQTFSWQEKTHILIQIALNWQLVNTGLGVGEIQDKKCRSTSIKIPFVEISQFCGRSYPKIIFTILLERRHIFTES